MALTLQDLINHIYTLADEEGEPDEITKWLNDAVATINMELNANFPFFNLNNPDFQHPIPQTWQHLTLIPFALGRVKQIDASQFEYGDAYAEFQSNLRKMKMKYSVPVLYQDPDAVGDVFDADHENNPYNWTGW